MTEINYETSDKSLKIKLVYITGHPLKIYGGIGKSWPRTTQCIIYENGIFASMGTVVKHFCDKDDLNFAMRLATKKALSNYNLPFKELRKDIWDLVLEKTTL